MGRPFMEYSGLGSIASTNYVAAVGDFRQYMIVDRIGMSVELVPHVFQATGANTPAYPLGERGVYAIWRNSAIVLTPSAFGLLKVR